MMLPAIKTMLGTSLLMFLWAILVKLIALIIGPIGTAYFSIIREYIKLWSFIFSLDSNIAIIKGLNSIKSSVERGIYIRFLKNIFLLNYVIFIIIYLFYIYFFKDYIQLKTGIEEGYHIILLVVIILQSTAYIFNSFLNSIGKLGYMIVIQIISVLSGIIFFYTNINGNIYKNVILYSLILISIVWLFLLYFCLKKFNFFKHENDVIIQANKNNYLIFFVKTIAGTTIVGIGTTVLGLYTKSYISSHYGMFNVGIYDCSYTLAISYLSVILSAVGTYLIPELFKEIGGTERKKLIEKSLIILIPIFSIIALALSFFSDFFIYFFYSSEYVNGSSYLLNYFLFGDIFKVISWVLISQIMANKKIFHFVFISYIWNFLFYIFISIFNNQFDDFGLNYILSNMIYLIIVMIYFKFLTDIDPFYLISKVYISVFLFIISMLSIMYFNNNYSLFFIIPSIFIIILKNMIFIMKK